MTPPANPDRLAERARSEPERFHIRRARPAEAEILTELSLRSKAIWGYEASFLARCRTVMQLLPAMIRDNPYYLAEADSDGGGDPALLGFYGFEPEPDGIGLDMFFVEPAAMGRGVGRALWNHAVGRARRLGAAALVVQSDPNAAGFYRKMGCCPAGGRPSEIEPGRTLPVFRFALSEPPA